jgi:hypothetical protein
VRRQERLAHTNIAIMKEYILISDDLKHASAWASLRNRKPVDCAVNLSQKRK